MASLNEISYAFADSVGKGLDIQFIRRVKFSVKYWRAFLLRQEAERTNVNQANTQSFVSTLIDVDEADSCVVVAGCKLKRTTLKVPKPVQIKGSDPFQYVGPVKIKCDTDIAFAYSPSVEISYAQHNNYTKNIVRYFLRNGYVYVTGDCLRKYIRITSLFENPVEAAEACDVAANCVSDDDEFPIGAHMLNTIIQGLQSNELKLQVPNNEVLIEEA